jgi:hypothetical protein
MSRNDVRGFKHLTETKRHTEMKHTAVRTSKVFVACGRSDVAPKTATRSATVDMAVKWRLDPRNHYVYSSSIPQNLSLAYVQWDFWRKFHKNPLSTNSVREWYNRFQDTGLICKKKRLGPPATSEKTIDSVRRYFLRSPPKSTRRDCRVLSLPQ